MTQSVLLNNVDHLRLRVETARGADYGDATMAVLTFPAEFRNVQAYYPIVFQKNPDGSFHPVALFGLHAGQNLFLGGRDWDAHYIPLAAQRQPFMIGVGGGEPMVKIDLDHPRVTAGTGELVFYKNGDTTQYLDRITAILQALHDGLQSTPAYVEALLALDLLEPFEVDMQLDDDAHVRLAGYYTINKERLRELDAEQLGDLAANGYIEPTYMAIASMSHLRDLVERYRKVIGHE